ncbi:hypothetical protein [Phenylobacterium sp.]|uniref:hypothetical protein n=1 Tax=Phenylobacterium sp. TaxID=1871053 RepID=UPI00271FE489|nr:hypothetical protein [Phenylobacterium sp.]MDO8380315.1 hypothetical protein [Phenylobacterium sp.]
MKPITLLSAIAAAGLCWAPAASAQVVTSAVNICEIAPGGGSINTVRLNLFSFSDVSLEYTFRKQPTGPTYQFPSVTPTSTSTIRKFAVPEGTYKLSYKSPNNPAIGVYGQNIVVRPFQLQGQTCVFINPRNRADIAGPPRN